MFFYQRIHNKLVGQELYWVLDGYFGYTQIAITPYEQEMIIFTCLYGTFVFYEEQNIRDVNLWSNLNIIFAMTELGPTQIMREQNEFLVFLYIYIILYYMTMLYILKIAQKKIILKIAQKKIILKIATC